MTLALPQVLSRMRKICLAGLLCIIGFSMRAQEDSLLNLQLDKVVVKSYRFGETTTKLSEVHGTYLVAGHKNEVLPIQELPANLAEKTGRQLFAKIPGAFIYDMDGSGNQINVSMRGLDAHRSWEFNVRQNGVMINSDIYGYPASHYSMPMEAVKNIEIIHGTASLQYGAEFGGMINYVLKEPDTTRPVAFESINSVGSFGLLSTYNALGGKVGKLRYYAYVHRRVSDGYRENAESSAQGQYLHLEYQFSARLKARLEVGRSQYRYRIPGPLTDSLFYANPRQATRNRNYFEPDIYVPSFTLEYQCNPRTRVQWTTSGVFGNRNSVEFEGFADKPDLIDPATLTYKNRTVNIDQFRTKTSELRLLHHYAIGKLENIVTASITYFNNNLHRRQQGKGTTGSDYDLTISGDWGRDLYYHSQNIALALENMIRLSTAFSVSPGMRYEFGQTDMTGYIAYLDPSDIPNHIRHRIPLAGINMQFQPNDHVRLFGGIAQAYRPVLFKDIIPGSTLEKANKDLKDAYGYNAELGISGKVRAWIKYDLTAFMIRYNNRLGSLVLQEDGKDYIYKTNIGDSETRGLELYTEIVPYQSRTVYVSLFTATSWMDARYRHASLAINGQNTEIDGNKVESVPEWITRNGLNIGYKTLRVNLLYSYVSETFSDPANTALPTSNGAKGIVPGYGLFDLNMSFRFGSNLILRAGVNNLTDHQYFTKRPLFYPGPGVWSSDGRSVVVSVGAKF